MHIEPFRITRPDGIDSTYGVLRTDDGTKIPKILVVAFSGTYPDGSLGNAHGHYIAYATIHGLAAVEPWCVILDFRDLEYRWGNALLHVFEQISRFMDDSEDSETKFPIVVVTSDKCRDAFLSLVTRTGDSSPDWHFNDMDVAIEYSIREADIWIDS